MPYTPVECRAKVARLHAPEKVFLLHCRMQLFPALPEVVRGIFRRPEALAVCPPGGAPRERGMFLNQTANYGLSQWEATDRILMEDFNSDNSKIDAALAGLDTRAAALEALKGLLKPGDALLAKASRGMKLENILKALYGEETLQ